MSRVFTRRSTMGLLASTAAVAACEPSRFIAYDGPAVTRIEGAEIGRGRCTCRHHSTVLESYEDRAGVSPPDGHKDHPRRQGSATPEGRYHRRTGRQPQQANSTCPITASASNAEDVPRRHRARGVSPGDEHLIHGTPEPVAQSR